MSVITLSDVLYLNTDNKSSYIQGLYPNNSSDILEMPNNSCYLLAAYEKENEFPYSHKFITIIRDNKSSYYLINHNIFVGINNNDFDKEKCNFIYQDTIPLITYKNWINVVTKFKMKDITRKNKYIKIFNKHNNWDFLFGENTKKISYNQAFQLFRFLEICSNEDFNLFLSSYKYTLKRLDNFNYNKWNDGLNIITTHFSKFQNKLIYNNFIQNLKYYKLKSKINIDLINIIIGRLDARHAGIITTNYCHPNKYIDFWKDYNKFGNKNIIALGENETPNILKLPKIRFPVFSKNTLNYFDNKYLDNNQKKQLHGFFSKESFDEKYTSFTKFISNNKLQCEIFVKAIIIGSNDNGKQYSESLKLEHTKLKNKKKK